jgi:cytoplasmic iron level regulating protein YaaA (DUF328/UPF0246 family)
MSALELIYQNAMALPENERVLLLDMLGQQNKKFDLVDLISDDQQKLIAQKDMIKELIKSHFSKFRNIKHS